MFEAKLEIWVHGIEDMRCATISSKDCGYIFTWLFCWVLLLTRLRFLVYNWLGCGSRSFIKLVPGKLHYFPFFQRFLCESADLLVGGERGCKLRLLLWHWRHKALSASTQDILKKGECMNGKLGVIINDRCCQLIRAAVEQCVFQKQFETVLLLRILKSIETRS